MSQTEPYNEKAQQELQVDESNGRNTEDKRYPVKWYRSSFYNAVILGLCNFCAPGIWGAMNALGGAYMVETLCVSGTVAKLVPFCIRWW